MLSLRQKTYILTSQIPQGKVLTYKELTFLASIPSQGYRTLSSSKSLLKYTCYRVVNASGKSLKHMPLAAEISKKKD
jgi:alkylated DNA nucleotide flippase Atl1